MGEYIISNEKEFENRLSRILFDFYAKLEDIAHSNYEITAANPVQKEHSMDPWAKLKIKIEAAASKPCCICNSCDDIKAPHSMSGGDFGSEVLIVPLCKLCRRNFFLDKKLQDVLANKYPEQIDYISF